MTPHSPGTGQINTLIWIGFIAAAVIVVAINLGLFGAIRRFRDKRGRVPRQQGGGRRLQFRVAGALSGFAILLFVLGIIFTSNATSVPKTGPAGLTSLKSKPLVIKATGQQWIWRYDYPNGSFSYWKLVIPVDTAIELDLESTDVVHTWSVPDLAPKTDAVPGKVSHIVFRADTEGSYFGQAATLSGQAYAPMRTTVEVVSPETYETFIKEQQKSIVEAQERVEKIGTEKLEEEEALEGGESSSGTGEASTEQSETTGSAEEPAEETEESTMEAEE